MGATNKGAVSKLVKAWEAKNDQSVKRAAGLGLMAVSLAACGSSDDSDDGDDDTDTTTVSMSASLTIDQDIVEDGTDTGEGDDTITGLVLQDNAGDDAQTLDAEDEIDGGDGDDILTVTLLGDAGSPMISNVETIIVRSTNAAADLDLANASGVETITVRDSATVMPITGIQNNVVIGLDNTSANVTLTFADDALDSDEAEISINADGFEAQIELVTSGGDVVTSYVIDASGDDSELELHDVDQDATSLTVTGDAAIELTEDSTEFALLETIDFSGNSGGVTIDLDTNDVDFTLTGSSGDDDVTVGSDGADGRTVDLGAGDDTIAFGAGDINADDAIDGGAGDNTVEIDVDDADEIDDRFTNFTAVTLTAASAANAALDLTDTGITTVTLASAIDLHTGADELSIDNYDGALTIVIADADLGGANADLTIASVGTTDAVSISFEAGAATTISDIDLTDIETVSLSTDSAADDVTMTAATVLDGVETITISGAGNLALTSTTVDALTTVDASDMSGDFDFSVTDADINALTITLGDFATGSSITLDAGEDEADVIVLTDVITDDTDLAIAEFSADATADGDTIDLSAFDLASSDLTITDGGVNTVVSFETADGFAVDITLTAVTGVAASDILNFNIEL
jgi:S-layer protein